MTGPQEPLRPDVWGDGPRPASASVPLGDQAPDTGTGRPLDLSQDPDLFVPGPVPVVPAAPRRLDPARDPDRYGGPGDRTLTDLLGEGAQEEERETYAWLGGLLSVLAFLAVVAFLSRYLGP